MLGCGCRGLFHFYVLDRNFPASGLWPPPRTLPPPPRAFASALSSRLSAFAWPLFFPSQPGPPGDYLNRSLALWGSSHTLAACCCRGPDGSGKGTAPLSHGGTRTTKRHGSAGCPHCRLQLGQLHFSWVTLSPLSHTFSEHHIQDLVIFSVFKWPHVWHMEVPRLGVK